MDLGVQIEPQFGFTFEEILAIANEARAAGFTRLWVSDHLFNDADAVATDCLEAWSLLAALAVKTEGIRIGAMVTCQSYRNPALLAKIAAGVDVMSGGRLDFGVGAGWKEIEYRAYGYPFPDGPTRVTQLLETLEICTRLWREQRGTFPGKPPRSVRWADFANTPRSGSRTPTSCSNRTGQSESRSPLSPGSPRSSRRHAATTDLARNRRARRRKKHGVG